MVAARLLRKDGSLAFTMAENYDLSKDYVVVKKVPTACVAFRNDGTSFDQSFVGSGFEDDDFEKQLLFKYSPGIVDY